MNNEHVLLYPNEYAVTLKILTILPNDIISTIVDFFSEKKKETVPLFINVSSSNSFNASPSYSFTPNTFNVSPSYSLIFSSDHNTGVYTTCNDNLSITTAGTNCVEISTNSAKPSHNNVHIITEKSIRLSNSNYIVKIEKPIIVFLPLIDKYNIGKEFIIFKTCSETAFICMSNEKCFFKGNNKMITDILYLIDNECIRLIATGIGTYHYWISS